MKNKFLKGLVASLALAVSGMANAGLIDFTTFGTIQNYRGNLDFEVSVFGGPETDINLAPHISEGRLVNSSDPSDISVDYPTEDIFRFFFFESGVDSINVNFNSGGIYAFPFAEVRAFDYNGDVLGVQSWTINEVNTIDFDFAADIATLEIDSKANEWRNSGNWWYFVNSINYTLGEKYVNVPEPTTLAILALGMIGLASRRFKKQPKLD